MVLLGLLLEKGNLIPSRLQSGTNFTGYLSYRELPSSSACLFVEVYTAWLHRTLRTSVLNALWNLRSAVRVERVVPLARKSTLGSRSFKYSGPSFGNALPHDIRDYCLTLSQFTSGLKTLLYREAYYP